MQRFAAREKFEFSNGAIGWRPGGPFDCLGPYAKIQACPIAGTNVKRTAYATSYADTMWSIPACTRYKGKYIKGHFSYLVDRYDIQRANRSASRRITGAFRLNQGYRLMQG